MSLANRHPHGAFERGLTLIELMVALVMGLVLIGGLASVFVANKQSYRHQEGLSQLQENGRFALAVLERDIRRAGAGQALTAALVGDTVIPADAPNNDCTFVNEDSLPRVINGVDGGDDARLADLNLDPPPEPGTDVLSVTVGVELGVDIVKDAAFQASSEPGNPNVPMDVASNCGKLYPGMMVIAVSADGNSMARFVVNSIPNCDAATGEGQFHHGGGQAPDGFTVKNCTHKLGPAGYAGGYLVGTESFVYYISRRCESCPPSLYRSRNLGRGEEMVEGVEDMQVRFGIGPESTRVVERYVVSGSRSDWSAHDIWEGEEASDPLVNWKNVRSARVQLLLQSTRPKTLAFANPVLFEPAGFVRWNYCYRDEDCEGDDAVQRDDDGRWRQAYSATVALRNRLP